MLSTSTLWKCVFIEQTERKLAVYLVGLLKTLLFSPHKAIDKSAYGDLARVGYCLLFNVYFDKYQNLH